MSVEKDCIIVIERVANGFLIRPHTEERYMQVDIYVFESFQNLVNFLNGHFTPTAKDKTCEVFTIDEKMTENVKI